MKVILIRCDEVLPKSSPFLYYFDEYYCTLSSRFKTLPVHVSGIERIYILVDLETITIVYLLAAINNGTY